MNPVHPRAARHRRTLCLVVLLLGLGGTGAGLLSWGDDQAGAAECATTTDALDAMPWGELIVPGAGTVQVRLLRDPQLRQAGMQHLCAPAVADNPMLFLFPEPIRPAFHMTNVHAALDIAFIGPDGRVLQIEHMEPGQAALTRPERPVCAALEVHAGQARALGLEEGSRLDWVDRARGCGSSRN